MGYFQVRYDARVVNYDRRGFIRLATGPQPAKYFIRCFYLKILKNIIRNKSRQRQLKYVFMKTLRQI